MPAHADEHEGGGPGRQAGVAAGRFSGAAHARARPPAQAPVQQMWVGFVLGRAGLVDSARRMLERSTGNSDIDPQRELLGYIAAARLSLGDKDEALRLLNTYLVANPKHRDGFRK